MNDNSLARLWFMRLAFITLAALTLFIHLLPMQTTPGHWPGPDLLIALGFSWALRRGDYVPVPLFALVMFSADLLLGRPPGLYAALSVIALESLKSRAQDTRNQTFFTEWSSAALAILAVLLLYHILLAVFLVAPLSLLSALQQIVLTILCYPVVTLLSYVILGLRKPQTGDVNALGQRL